MKNTIWLTVLITICSFLSVSYTACKKSDDSSTTDKCRNMTCQNGGSCFRGVCTCVAGFEGANCQIEWRTKYLGRWSVTEKITASSVDSFEGKEKKYIWSIRSNPSKAHGFIIDTIMGNSNFTDIPCTIGLDIKRNTTTPERFAIDLKTFSAANNMQILAGAGGITANLSILNGFYYTSSQIGNVPVLDTISFSANYVGQ